jgi:hypothetical protein
MKLALTAALVVALVIPSSTAAKPLAYPIQSPPFTLHTVSDDQTLNDQTLRTCHAGPGHRPFCLSAPGAGEKFYVNWTDTTADGVRPTNINYGVLNCPYIYVDLLGYRPSLSASIMRQDDPPFGQNLAVVIFGHNRQDHLVGFDDQEMMYFRMKPSDNLSFDIPETEKVDLKRFVWCRVNTFGYKRMAVGWMLGDVPADKDNPNCVKFEIKRVFD